MPLPAGTYRDKIGDLRWISSGELYRVAVIGNRIESRILAHHISKLYPHQREAFETLDNYFNGPAPTREGQKRMVVEPSAGSEHHHITARIEQYLNSSWVHLYGGRFPKGTSPQIMRASTAWAAGDIACMYCGEVCHGGAAHKARVEDKEYWVPQA